MSPSPSLAPVRKVVNCVTIMPRFRSSPKFQQGAQISYVKAKGLYVSSDLDSPCVNHIDMIREPWAQLRWRFYHSRGCTGGFLRFRTPDCLTFVQGCLGERCLGVCWAEGHLVIYLHWLEYQVFSQWMVPGWFQFVVFPGVRYYCLRVNGNFRPTFWLVSTEPWHSSSAAKKQVCTKLP